MLYHASPTGGLTILTPHVSNHGHPLVYFSKKPGKMCWSI